MSKAQAEEVATPKEEEKEEKTVSAKAPRFMVFDRWFRIPPVKVKAKDNPDEKIILEWRTGRDGGAWTIDQYMTKTGADKELLKKGTSLEKKFPDRRVFKEFFDSLHMHALGRIRTQWRSYRSYIARKVRSQGIRPIAAFVPVDDPENPIGFIQGFIRIDTLAPAAGEIADIVLALEATNARLKPMVDEYRENQQVARKIMGLPGVNKDIQNRLGQVVSGNLDRALLLERFQK